MPGFRPRPQYIREMKRYGVLPPSFDAVLDPIDPYAVDRQYWDLFGWEGGSDGRLATQHAKVIKRSL